MKLNPTSTQPQIFKHPWYTYLDLKAPNPPTDEAVSKAQFKDKTYKWNHK